MEALSRLRPNAGETHLASRNIFTLHIATMIARWRSWRSLRSTLPNAPRIRINRFHCAATRAHEDGIRKFATRIELDPRNFFTLQQIAFSYELVRRYPRTARRDRSRIDH